MGCIRLRLIAPSLASAFLAAALALTGCAAASKTGIEPETVAEDAAKARTRADHENLATYFDEQAQAALKRAQDFQALRGRYDHRAALLFYPIGVVSELLAHHDALIRANRDAAARYEALARLHRALAAGAEQ